MPLYALIARDRPGLEHRQTNRPAHLEHMAKLDATGRIRYGGPLVNDSQDMVGSLIIIEANIGLLLRGLQLLSVTQKQNCFQNMNLLLFPWELSIG